MKFKKRNQKILEFEEYWLKNLGLFPSRDVPAFRLVIFLILIFMMFLAMLNFVRHHSDVDHVIILLPEFVAILVSMIKIITFLVNREGLIQFTEQLKEEWELGWIAQYFQKSIDFH
jgi:hypothetical protein